jgi:hypothetical protein
VPPEPPGGAPPGDGSGSVTFAIRHLALGDQDPNGSYSATAWKGYGYDIDGKISIGTSTDLCKPSNNASASHVYPDGNAGIDNAFGKDILPLLTTISPSLSQQMDDRIAQGKLTLLFDIQKLGAGSNYSPLVADFYVGADRGSPPAWTGTDAWPMRFESMLDPTNVTKGAKARSSASYLTSNTWVSGSIGTISVPLSFGGVPMDLTIHGAVVTMELDAAHAHAAKGVISGVLSTAELVAAVKTVAGALDPQLCSGSLIESVATQLGQASDIMADGTQDPSKECDGVSIGLGFAAERVLLGPVAPPIVPLNPCGI